MRYRSILFLVLVSFSAFADDVPPPPTDCPPGSVGYTGHAGPYCAPVNCQSDSECKDGLVCQEMSLCIIEEQYTNGRMPDEKPKTRYVVSGACDAQKVCKSTSEKCTTSKYCAPKSAAKPSTPEKTTEEKTAPPPAETKTKTSSCTVSPVAEAPLSLLLLLGLGVLTRRKQKDRR